MDLEKTRIRTRNIFFTISLLALGINLMLSDLIYKESKTVYRISKVTFNDYRSSVVLRRLKWETNFSSLDNDKIQSGIDQLKILQPSSLDQSDLAKLENFSDLSPLEFRTQINILHDKIDFNLGVPILEGRLNESYVDRLFYWLVLIDILLIGSLMSAFVVNLLIKKKIEAKLKAALTRSRDFSTDLEKTIFDLESRIRVTAHDLKNPIGNIKGFAEVLKDEVVSEYSSDSSLLGLAERIEKISDKSLKMVEGLVQRQIHLNLEKVDVAALLRETISEFQVQASTKGQIIDYRGETYAEISGDRLRLEEVFANILSNAIKYSPEGSEIKIRTRRDLDSFEINFKDEGPGFTESDIKNAFQYGKKLSASPTAGEKSSGLGLYIVKQLVEKQSGSIEILNRKSKPGAFVKMRFPLLSLELPKSEAPL